MKNQIFLASLILLVGISFPVFATEGDDAIPSHDEMIGFGDSSGQDDGNVISDLNPMEGEDQSTPYSTEEEESQFPMIAEDGEETPPLYTNEEDESVPLFFGDEELIPLESEEAAVPESDSNTGNN
ncbi:MAG: hypothetical protein ACQ9MH_15265 [Nitrospinales bacterium]